MNEYLKKVSDYMNENPGVRYGQACYNVLNNMNNTLALEINGSELDPFYDDKKVPSFLAHISDII